MSTLMPAMLFLAKSGKAVAEESIKMETPPAFAIAHEAARGAFLYKHGFQPDFEAAAVMTYQSSIDEEKAELLASIHEEVQRCSGSRPNDLCMDVCRDLLTHLAAGVQFGNDLNAVTVQ